MNQLVVTLSKATPTIQLSYCGASRREKRNEKDQKGTSAKEIEELNEGTSLSIVTVKFGMVYTINIMKNLVK